MAYPMLCSNPITKQRLTHWTPRNKFHWNWNKNTNISIHQNAFENIYKMDAILFRTQCDKIHSVDTLLYIANKGNASDDNIKRSGRQCLIVDGWYNILAFIHHILSIHSTPMEGQLLFKIWAPLIRFPQAFFVISHHILFSVDGDTTTPCGHQTVILWPITIHKWRTSSPPSCLGARSFW